MNGKFISLISCFAVATLSVASADVFVSASHPDVLFMGRTKVNPSGSRSFNFPGVTAMLNFSGTSLDMQTSPGSGYFMVEIDSLPPRKIFYASSDSIMTIAESLADGPHAARITYAIEGFEFKPEIKGFILHNDGKLLAAPERPKLRIEFIGNSITCGYGTEATDGNVPFSYDTENHCLSYAHLTARALGADYNVVSRSGIGVYRNYGSPTEGSPEGTMPMEYERTMIYDPTSDWDFSQFRPDIICVNLGTNDMSEDKYDIYLFEYAYKKFLANIRWLNPRAKIVLLTGSMLQGRQLDDVKVVLDRLAAWLPEVYRFDMTPQTGSLGYGADWHPSAAQSRQMSAELAAYLRTLLP